MNGNDANADESVAVLLIEDNPGDARLIEEMFAEAERSGHPAARPVELAHAETLSAGCDRLDARGFDVVLLDLQLPDSKGMETLETVLSRNDGSPVIILTGMPEATLGVEAVTQGAQDYLVKDDVTPEVLVRAIRYAIERKKTERELRQRTRELAILNQLTRHDIKNDITLVVGRARELTEYVEPRGQDALDEIIQSSNHILQLTRTIGDIVDSVTDADEVELTAIDLEGVLEGEVEKARRLYRGVDVRLDNEAPGARIRANELLSSVFGNLISNAIFYNDKETPEVTVSVVAESETVVVRVADNGPGIPDRRKDEIFAEGTSGMESSGLGIGLSLVDRLVTRYGGDIWIEDNEPEGTVFCVALNRA